MDKSCDLNRSCTSAAEFLRGLADHGIVSRPRLEMVEDYQATSAKDLFTQLSLDVQSLHDTGYWDSDCIRSIKVVAAEISRFSHLLYRWKLPVVVKQDPAALIAITALLQSWLTAIITWLTTVSCIFMPPNGYYRERNRCLPDHALTSMLSSFLHAGAAVPVLREIKAALTCDSPMGLDILLITIAPLQIESILAAFCMLTQLCRARPEMDQMCRSVLSTEKLLHMLTESLDFAAFLHEVAFGEDQSKEVVEYACRIVQSAEQVFEQRGDRVEFCEALMTKGWLATI